MAASAGPPPAALYRPGGGAVNEPARLPPQAAPTLVADSDSRASRAGRNLPGDGECPCGCGRGERLVPVTIGAVSTAPDVALEFVRRMLRPSAEANPLEPPGLLLDLRPPARQVARSATEPKSATELGSVAVRLREAGATHLAVLDDHLLGQAPELARQAGLPLLDPVPITLAAIARQAVASGPALLMIGPDMLCEQRYRAEASRFGLAVRFPEPQSREGFGQAIRMVQQGEPARARPLALEVALEELRRLTATAELRQLTAAGELRQLTTPEERRRLTAPDKPKPLEAAGPVATVVLASPALAVVLRPGDFQLPVVDCLEELARAAARLTDG